MSDGLDGIREMLVREIERLPEYPPRGASFFWREWQTDGWWWGNRSHSRGPWPSFDAALADFKKAYPEPSP